MIHFLQDLPATEKITVWPVYAHFWAHCLHTFSAAGYNGGNSVRYPRLSTRSTAVHFRSFPGSDRQRLSGLLALRKNLANSPIEWILQWGFIPMYGRIERSTLVSNCHRTGLAFEIVGHLPLKVHLPWEFGSTLHSVRIRILAKAVPFWLDIQSAPLNSIFSGSSDHNIEDLLPHSWKDGLGSFSLRLVVCSALHSDLWMPVKVSASGCRPISDYITSIREEESERGAAKHKWNHSFRISFAFWTWFIIPKTALASASANAFIFISRAALK